MLARNIPLTFLERDPNTGALQLRVHDALDEGGALLSRAPLSFDLSRPQGGKVLVLGAGVGGLTAAYDLLKQNQDRRPEDQFQVFLLEAMGRVGGRSITLRPGDPDNPTPRDSFTEVVPRPEGPVEVTQTLTFEHEEGEPYPPYLNAGPGRIPSGHIQVLRLCKELGVELEVYIMESRANKLAPFGKMPDFVWDNAQVLNDIRGYVAKKLFNIVAQEQHEPGSPEADQQQKMLLLLRYFGALEAKNLKDGASPVADYIGSQRAGYSELPGLIHGGKLKTPIAEKDLLDAGLDRRSIYQAEDFLWQTTSFQPVGGMDMIEKKLQEKIIEMGRNSQWNYNPILLNAPARHIRRVANQWLVQYEQNGKVENLMGDYCVSNIPIPLLDKMINPGDFDADYYRDLKTVIDAKGFFRPTCKVGWQAERRLWQEPQDPNAIPIFGGISRIEHRMTQMWYPSENFHARLGALTGAYNYEEDAEEWGKWLPEDRIEDARQGAEILHGEEFASQLKHGISIAWQNIPTLTGGWPSWQAVTDDVREQARLMNSVRRGNQGFHVVGDQVSFWPGWKEGAVASALEVFALIVGVSQYRLPEITEAPITRELVQGFQY